MRLTDNLFKSGTFSTRNEKTGSSFHGNSQTTDSTITGVINPHL